jgi:hypothetical protein
LETKKQVRLGSNPGERRTSTRAPANRTEVRESHRWGASFFRGSIKIPSRISTGQTEKKNSPDNAQRKILRTHRYTEPWSSAATDFSLVLDSSG